MQKIQDILFASTNSGKLAEVRSASPVPIISPLEIERRIGMPAPEVSETERTYLGNARLKAESYFNWSRRHATLADDTGLEVAALGGAPGIYSARYAGEGANPRRNIQKLLEVMQGKSERNATFVCQLVLILPNGEQKFSRGELHGTIAEAPRGDGGFGYDSIFIVDDAGSKTLAELKAEKVALITHRGAALRKLFEDL